MQARGASALSRRQPAMVAWSASVTAVSSKDSARVATASAKAMVHAAMKRKRPHPIYLNLDSGAARSSRARTPLALPLGLVARPRFGVGRVEAGKGYALFDLPHDPEFEKLLLRSRLGGLLDERRRDDDRSVAVRHDHVIRKHSDPAAADRLLPADKRKTCDRGWSRDAGAPHRQSGHIDPSAVAHASIGDKGRDAALLHAGAQDVAEDSCVL